MQWAAGVRTVDTSARIVGMAREWSAETFVGFAVRWEPYGGAGDEDIFVAFGISSAEYRRRLWWALNLPGGPDLDDDIRDRLRVYAQAYHAPTSPSGL
jgi:hypothetical protein